MQAQRQSADHELQSRRQANRMGSEETGQKQDNNTDLIVATTIFQETELLHRKEQRLCVGSKEAVGVDVG